MTWLGQNKAATWKFGSILLCINCSDCCWWWCKAVCFTTYRLNVLKPIIIAVQWCLTWLKPLITAIQLSNYFLELASASTVLEWPSQSPSLNPKSTYGILWEGRTLSMVCNQQICSYCLMLISMWNRTFPASHWIFASKILKPFWREKCVQRSKVHLIEWLVY